MIINAQSVAGMLLLMKACVNTCEIVYFYFLNSLYILKLLVCL